MVFVNRWDKQTVVMYKCGHNFHQRCVANNSFECTLCFNEYDHIRKFLFWVNNFLNAEKIIQSRNSNIGIRGRASSIKRKPGAAAGGPTSGRSSKNTNPTTSDSDSEHEQPIKEKKEDYQIPNQYLTDENSEMERFEKSCLLFEMAINSKEMNFHQYM